MKEKYTALVNWCCRHPYRFSIYYFIFYLAYFFILERIVTEPVWIVSCSLDAWIPFSRFALIPYVLWFPFLGITVGYMMFKAPRKEYVQTCMTMYIGMTLCLIFYCIVPNGLNLRPATVEGNDLLAWAVQGLWKIDTPMNVCPSLHVYTTVCMDIGWQRSSLLKGKKNQWKKIGIRILDIAICAAVVFLKQHSVIDVISGLVLAWIMNALVSRSFQRLPVLEEV